MSRKLDLTDQVFGQLTAVCLDPTNERDRGQWICSCSCGEFLSVDISNLRSENTRSCGCLNRETRRRNKNKGPDIAGQVFGRLTALYIDTSCKKQGIFWICDCSCGKRAIVSGSNLRRNVTKSCGCYRQEVIHAKGSKHFAWAGGKTKTNKGYMLLRTLDGYVQEHRHVMEQKLGRKLLSEETVHHINGIKTDNRPDNLELWSKSHPAGQRVSDLRAWALEILKKYPSP